MRYGCTARAAAGGAGGAWAGRSAALASRLRSLQTLGCVWSTILPIGVAKQEARSAAPFKGGASRLKDAAGLGSSFMTPVAKTVDQTTPRAVEDRARGRPRAAPHSSLPHRAPLPALRQHNLLDPESTLAACTDASVLGATNWQHQPVPGAPASSPQMHFAGPSTPTPTPPRPSPAPPPRLRPCLERRQQL